MIQAILKKIMGTKNDRTLKTLGPRVQQVNDLESTFKAFSDDDLKAMTGKFRERIDNGESLDELLPEAFAVVREASIRTLQMRHYDVQLVGGVALHQGTIAEMKTGEGKTLVATLPVYLNALAGKGVHVVTVNDYLARRDSENMGRLYGFLGLSTGVIHHGLDDQQRRAAGKPVQRDRRADRQADGGGDRDRQEADAERQPHDLGQVGVEAEHQAHGGAKRVGEIGHVRKPKRFHIICFFDTF